MTGGQCPYCGDWVRVWIRDGVANYTVGRCPHYLIIQTEDSVGVRFVPSDPALTRASAA